MKINECSVIDNKVIDRMISIYNVYLENAIQDECSLEIINSIRVKLYVMEYIKSHLKPLAPIIEDAYTDGMSTDGDWEYCSNKYVEETEI